MALRDPSVKAKGTRWDNVQIKDVPGDDYRSTQVRDLRDAVNEWIAKTEEDLTLDTVNVWKSFLEVISRIEALEAKMVDNTPKGGYNLKSEGTK